MHGHELEGVRAGNRLVLAAPTGSGKSTQVPQMLVDQLGMQRVVVLQPRRVAARTLAAMTLPSLRTPSRRALDRGRSAVLQALLLAVSTDADRHTGPRQRE